MSYSDLVTNLMAIFVLLFSMSTLDAAKFDTVSSEVTQRQTDNLAELQKKIDAKVAQHGLTEEVRTSLGWDGLRVVFQGSSMFKSASASLIPKHVSRLAPVFEVLASSDPLYKITLEGHTDDVPLRKGSVYPDNWVLSSARGVSLLHVLEARGIPFERMSVGGYAHTRPVVDPSQLKGEELQKARALNRRVVIRVSQ